MSVGQENLSHGSNSRFVGLLFIDTPITNSQKVDVVLIIGLINQVPMHPIIRGLAIFKLKE